MKKILAILASLTLIGASSSSIISFSDALETPKLINNNLINDLDLTQLDKNDNLQVINQLSISLDFDSTRTTKQNIEFRVQQAINSLQIAAVQGVDYEIKGIQYNSSNRPAYAGSYTVKALPTSKLIRGEFQLHLWKNFTFNYPTSGTTEDGEYIKNQIRNDIQSVMPTAVEGKDYRFIDLSDNDNEMWMFSPITGSDIRGRFVFMVAKDPLNDISTLGFTIDINDPNNIQVNIENQILNRIWTKIPGVQLGVDYQIEPIPYDANNRPTQAGKFFVSALPTSKLIAGSFRVQLQKTLDLRDFEKSGDKLEGNAVKTRVINEIIRWKPTAVEGQDYNVINLRNGSWEIVTASNADVIVNFRFTVFLHDISDIVINLDVDQVTKNDIEAEINREISKLIAGTVLGTDYEIEPIPYGENNHPTQAGRFLVSALPTSEYITGAFNLRLEKTLSFDPNDGYPTSGSKEDGERIKQEIIDEIKKWNPNAEEGIDYEIIEEDGHWTIKSTPDSEIDVDFTFVYGLVDISEQSLLVFDVTKPQTTKTYIEDEVSNAINSLLEGPEKAVLGIDYTIGDINYTSNQNPRYATKVEVSALRGSNLIKGSFVIQLKAILSFDDYYDPTGTWLDGEETRNNIIASIYAWAPYAIKGIDFEITETSDSWTIRSLPESNLEFEFTYTWTSID